MVTSHAQYFITGNIGWRPCDEELFGQAPAPVALPPSPLPVSEQSMMATLAQQVEALTLVVRGL